mgnify:CR=1 FL=1
MASDTLNTAHRHPTSVCASLTAAALYAGVSVIMVLSNKALLSSWHFDFTATLLLLQNGLTLGALALLRPASAFSGTLRTALSFPVCDATIARRTAPLAIAYLANVACGLAALRMASVPVYQVLKRLAPLPAMLLDSLLRGATFSRETRGSIALVAGGAVLTGIGDAEFDATAYAFALASCVLQALYLVLTSQARDLGLTLTLTPTLTLTLTLSPNPNPSQARDLGLSALGVLHYNALLSLPLLLLGAAVEAPRLTSYAHWAEPRFCCLLLTNAALGGAPSLLLLPC